MSDIVDAAHHSAMRITIRLILMAWSAYSSIALATPAFALRRQTPLELAQQIEAQTGGGPFDPQSAALAGQLSP